MAAVSSLLFCSFAIATNGIRFQSSWFVLLGVSLLGIPLGIFYLLCTELLTAWMPNNAGLAVGLGQPAFAMGSILFSGCFNSLVHSLRTANAVRLSGLLLDVPVLFASFLVSWPGTQICEEECGDQEIGYTEQASDSTKEEVRGENIQLAVLLRSSCFWLYMLGVFCSQTGFATVPFFFDMGTSFGSRLENVILLFQIVNTAGTLSRLCGGILADSLPIPIGKNGTKTLMVILPALQTLAFLSLGIVTNGRTSFWIFVVASFFCW